jgi:hypothetical protein
VVLKSTLDLQQFVTYVVGHSIVQDDVLSLRFGEWDGCSPLAATSPCTVGDMSLVLVILATLKKLRRLGIDAYWSPQMDLLLEAINALQHLRTFATYTSPNRKLAQGLERLSWQRLRRMDGSGSRLTSLHLYKIEGPFEVGAWPALASLALYRLLDLQDSNLEALLQSTNALVALVIRACPHLSHRASASIRTHAKSLEQIDINYMDNRGFLDHALPSPENYFADFGKLKTVVLCGTSFTDRSCKVSLSL